MSQSSSPADNVKFQSSAWRTLFAPAGDAILDVRSDATRGYPLTRPASGNDVTVGSGASRVAGFLHECVGPETLTIATATGSSRTDTIVVRYDPTFTDEGTGKSFPCRLAVVAGTPGGGPPSLDTTPPGVQDFPLYNITRAPGQALSATTLLDRRVWVAQGAGVVTPDLGLNGAPATALQAIPGRRTLTTDSVGRVTVTFPTPFPTGIHSVVGITLENRAGYGSELTGMTRAGFTVKLRSTSGAAYLNTSCTLHYLAYGY